MIEVSKMTISDEPAWQTYVESHPDATIYHTLAWRDIIYNEYRFEPVYLIAKETNPPLAKGGEGGFSGEGKVVGILPMFLVNNLRGRRLVSLPFSIYGGPLCETKAVVSLLLNKAIEMVKEEKVGSLEVKPYPQMDIDLPELAYLDCGICTTVDLTVGEGKLWKGLKNRNDVNRGVREELRFTLSNGEDIERFYRLQLMTRKRLGLPTPSLRYYSSFFNNLEGLVKVALVKKAGVPVAGGIFFFYKGKMLYALGASDLRYSNHRPNDMLIWEMIKWAAEAGYKEFDLGPAAFADKGLLHFKKKWGGREVLIRQYRYPSHSEYLTSVRGSNMLKIMPISVSKIISPKIIRLFG